MICNRCGNELDNNSPFCPYCGEKNIAYQKQDQQDNEYYDPSKNLDQLQQQPQYQPGYQQPQYQPGYQQPGQSSGNLPYVDPLYGQQPYGQSPYGQSPYMHQNEKKSSKGLIICIICGGVVLFLLAVVLFVSGLYGFIKGVDEGYETSNQYVETTTELAEYDSSIDGTPYGEKMGYVFSDYKDVKISGTGSTTIEDIDGNKLNLDVDDYLKDYGYDEYIESIAVTDPDEEGYVTYIVKFNTYEKAEVYNLPEEESAVDWDVNFWVPDISDYYTGRIIDYASGKRGWRNNTDTQIINIDGKKVPITFCRYSIREYEDAPMIEEGLELGQDEDGKRFLYTITVPQDYDGLVLSIPKVYDDSTNVSHDEDPSVPEYISDEKRPLMDVWYYGYTTVEDTIYVKLSDQAVPLTPEVEVSMVESNENIPVEYFEWYLDKIEDGQRPESQLGSYNTLAGKIDDPARIKGRWQGLVVWDPENNKSGRCEEYSNVSITQSDSDISLEFKYQYKAKYGTDWEDISSQEAVSYSGVMAEDGSVNLDSDQAKFTIDSFWSDGISQYAFGEIILPDGEKGLVVLQRP